MQKFLLGVYACGIGTLIKRILFLLDPEFVHEFIIGTGEKIGRFTILRNLVKKIFFGQQQKFKPKCRGN